MKYRHIFWDWNGTLINDGRACADAMDRMLRRRNLGSISFEDYREKITYPFTTFFHDLGIDLRHESYEDMCDEYIENYNSNREMATLQAGAHDILSFFKQNGAGQHIVSASEAGMLIRQVEEYGLTQYFDTVSGQKDNKAESKTHLAKRLITEIGCRPDEVLLVGDTLHDYEIAQSLGTECFLLSNGHCGAGRLSQTGARVFPDLRAIINQMHEVAYRG